MSRIEAIHWIFTENNPEGELNELFADLEAEGKITYACWQLEVGENGTEHFQGYINFSKKIRLSALKKIMKRAHWAVCRDMEGARNYCMKPDGEKETSFRLDGPWEIGTWNPKLNNAKVWGKIRDEVKEGKGIIDLVEKYPAQVFMYHKGINHIKMLLQKPRDWKTLTQVWIGPPGTGKSRNARDKYPNAYWKQPDSIWFDGYEGEETIVLDDFYGSLPWSTILQLSDRYACKLQVKGSTANLLAKNLIITSNKMPHEWYRKILALNRVDPIALFRRIDELHLYDDEKKEYYLVDAPLEYLTDKYNSWKNSREASPELYEN